MWERRSVMAPRGLVASPHPLATGAGLRVLQRGGTAVEAAIATASTLAVVYPHMNGLGGDNVWLIYRARTGEVHALLAIGWAGREVTIDAYRAAGYREIPRRGPLAANTVPGAVDGWAEAYAFSRAVLGGREPFEALLEDAVYYAEAGFPVTAGQAAWTLNALASGELADQEAWRRTFVRPDGSPPAPGDRWALPALAETLKVLGREGRDGFYRGPIARALCAALRARGGWLREEDFASFRSQWAAPLSVPYRRWTIFATPPPTQGVTSLQILRILGAFPVDAWGDDSIDYYHVMVEAAKLAIQDRDTWIADPLHVPVPVGELLSEGRALRHASRIDLGRASPPGGSAAKDGDTVSVAVVDAQGNAVSLIQSIYFDFGSGVVVEDTGVLLQNRGTAFSLDPSHPNALAPGKRPFHTLTPALALRDGRVELVYGTMGGEGQPQTQAALVTRILDLGMDVQAALDAPRWVYGRTWGAPTQTVAVESRVPGAVVEGLRSRGHDVRVVAAWDDRMGHAHAIRVDLQTGTRYGGADLRGDGIAAGC